MGCIHNGVVQAINDMGAHFSPRLETYMKHVETSAEILRELFFYIYRCPHLLRYTDPYTASAFPPAMSVDCRRGVVNVVGSRGRLSRPFIEVSMTGAFRKPVVSRNKCVPRRLPQCTRDERHALTRFLCFTNRERESEKLKERGDEEEEGLWRNVSETGKTGSALSVCVCVRRGIAVAEFPPLNERHCATTAGFSATAGPPPMALLARCRIGRIAAAAAGANARNHLGSRSEGRENGSGTGPGAT